MMPNLVRLCVCFAAAKLMLTVALSTAAQQPPNEGNRPRPRRAAVPKGVKVERDLLYAQAGDKLLLLDLYLPENVDGPLPVIVGIHGGGWATGSKAGDQGSWLAQHGYAVAVINYRLSGEATFPAQIEDCKAAVRWLRANAKKYHLDPDRFGASGHSAGGHLVSLLATTGDVKEFDKGENLEFSSRIQAACPLSGPTDFLQMDAHAPPGARLKHDAPNSPESRLIGGPIQENKDKVARANPITCDPNNHPSFLIVHGDQDAAVPAYQAELLNEALKKAGVETKLHLVKRAGHTVGGREVNALIVAFFDKHLKKAPQHTEPEAQQEDAKPASENVKPKGTATAAPVGLFVCRGPGPTPEKEGNFPFIDGWLVRPGWDKVEPQEGKFDWMYIDTEIALVKRLNKKVTLAVLGGPQAPEWLYGAGVKSFRFRFRDNPKYGKRSDREVKIPVLWDETYLAKWTALVHQLGKRYGSEEAVALIHVTGATGNGLEMQLPFGPDDRKNWDRLGYTPEKAIQAWQRILDAYAEAFPNKPLDIDLHPVLGSDKVATEVAAYGSKKLGKQFGVFGGWLSGKDGTQDKYHAGVQALAAKYGPLGLAAFQMIGNQTRQPERFAKGGLKAAIEQGMTWNAGYFEIWQSDAMNEALHPMLTELAAKLKK